MEAAEIHKSLHAIVERIGGKTYVSIVMSDEVGRRPRSTVNLAIHPDGITAKRCIYIDAMTFEEAFEKANAAWDAACEKHERDIVRRMAIEIIKVTADMGACSDAALRAGEFSDVEVQRYGERACIEANEIAGKGPFSIVTISSISNAA